MKEAFGSGRRKEEIQVMFPSLSCSGLAGQSFLVTDGSEQEECYY